MKKAKIHLNGTEITALKNDYNQGIDRESLMTKYNISRAAFYKMVKRTAILKPLQKKIQKTRYELLNNMVFEKFEVLRARGIPLSGPAIKLLASSAKRAILDDPAISMESKETYARAQFGDSWLDKFKDSRGMRNLRVNGERASVSDDVWLLMEPIIEEIRRLNIPISRIYNWDETGLFYRALPKYTLAAAGDNGAGANDSNQRITALLCVNADGSDISAVLIGKSATPRNTSPELWAELGLRYFSNDTAWMTAAIFNKLLQEFDERCNLSTVLILDNPSDHNIAEGVVLNNVIPIYLPPNTTAITQALDAGIIAAFKINYRSKLMEFVCERITDSNSRFNKNEITIFKIAPWIKNALDNLRPLSIQKCFYRTLKLESLKPDESTSSEELDESINTLVDDMSIYLQRPVLEQEALIYSDGVTLENTIGSSQQAGVNVTDDNEDVLIPNVEMMIEYAESLITYCNNTGLAQEAAKQELSLSKIQEHMNFQ